jgi:hypothetical protein
VLGGVVLGGVVWCGLVWWRLFVPCGVPLGELWGQRVLSGRKLG